MPLRSAAISFALVITGMLSGVAYGDAPPKCLPQGVDLNARVAVSGVQTRNPITVRQRLAALKAHCRKGKLLDRSGREIRFYNLIGCWGNPPVDYQELLQNQSAELARLKKKYTVIELPCQSNTDPRRIS